MLGAQKLEFCSKEMLSMIEALESRHVLDAAPPTTDEERISHSLPSEVKHCGNPRDLSRGRASL